MVLFRFRLAAIFSARASLKAQRKPFGLSHFRTFLIGAIAAGWLMPASAFEAGKNSEQSLKIIRAQNAAEEALQNQIGYTNSVCGGSIKASIDWNRVVNWPEDADLAAACDSALGALEAVCRAPGGQKRAASVKKFVCGGDGAGASFSGGTLYFGASPGARDFSGVKSYLESTLP